MRWLGAWLVALVATCGLPYAGWLLLAGAEPPEGMLPALGLLSLPLAALIGACLLQERPDGALEAGLLERWLARQRAQGAPERR